MAPISQKIRRMVDSGFKLKSTFSVRIERKSTLDRLLINRPGKIISRRKTERPFRDALDDFAQPNSILKHVAKKPMCLVGRRRSLGYENTPPVSHVNQENYESASIIGPSSQAASPVSVCHEARLIDLSPTHDFENTSFPSNEGGATLMDIFLNPSGTISMEEEQLVDSNMELIDFSTDVEINDTNGTESDNPSARLFWFEGLDDDIDYDTVLQLNRSSTKEYHGPRFNHQFGAVQRYMNIVHDEERFLEQATVSQRVSTTFRPVPKLIPVHRRSNVLPNPQLLDRLTIEMALNDVEFGRLHFMDSD